MYKDVKEYVHARPTCQGIKSDNRAKAKLLQPIVLPERKWQQITIDLVIDSPKSGGSMPIVVFVD